MAAPVINNFSVVMGSSGGVPRVIVSFNLQHADALVCELATNGFQYALESTPDDWQSASLDTGTPGTGLISQTGSPGRSTTLRWLVKTDLPNQSTSIRFRVNLKDSNSVESGYSTATAVAIKTTDPTLSFSLDSFTKLMTISFTPSTTNSPTYYKTSENAALTGASWVAIPPGGALSLTFASSTEGTKTVYAQLRDNYYNTSSIVSDTIILHTTAPTDGFLQINGSVPDSRDYTGMAIDDDGAMTPDRSATIDVYADDLYDIEMYVDGDIENGTYVRTWTPYRTGGTVVRSQVPIVFTGLDFNYDDDATVTVQFRDIAGNIASVSKSIRVNTKVFKAAHRLLRVPDASYDHQVMEVTQANTTDLVQGTVSVPNEYVRRWEDIFYPETHSYPKNPDGTINTSAAIAMGGVSNANYDAVQLSGGAIVYDSEGRVTTVNWTTNGTKDYRNLESSYAAAMRYWVIDNTGYGDIDLTFEYFYLDPNSYGPPFNTIAPYRGDHVVVYDASAEGAVQETIGPTGERSYTLLDSTKLVELYAYTGKGNQVIELSSGYSVNASTGGGFSVPTIRNISRICLVLYSDRSTTASGFKLKAGPRHGMTFRNYDIDNTNGELWLHKYPNGQSYTGTVRMIYDYADTEINFDLDEGEVIFAVDPSGVVTADYTYYMEEDDKGPADKTRLYAATNDDFVDYLTPSMYARRKGQAITAGLKAANYVFGAPTPSGRIASNYTVDKDRGVVEFYSGVGDGHDEYYYVPSTCRLTMDYFCHSYPRLANDGYGSLTFQDETIVADDTPVFPDYTFVDVKLVNEGDAILETGRILFLARGFDNNSDGVIDQVLDVNRPWDIQQGTAAETYDKVAMQVSQNYTFNLRPTKAEAKSILANWKNAYFGFNVYPRTVFYGRVVWVIGGTSGNSYPATSVGRKSFSAEVEGKFYNISV